MTLDPHKDRTALRLRLYENGLTPLPNKRKMCLLKGWSTIDVTPDLIQSKEWARSGRDKDTGIRCGDVIAVDIDIDDKDLLNDLLDAVVEQGLVEESPFVRIGKPPRELWVYRTSDKIGKRTTGHFGPEDRPEDFKGYAVEILGKGCQFAAFGERDDTTSYSWPEQSLLDHEYMDLPEITLTQVDALKDFCAAFFESRGLVRLSPGGGTDKGYTHAYDLTDEMEFEVQDIGPMTVADMADYFRANPEEVLRCKVQTLRPTGGSWAGMASLVGGSVCISDHGTYTSHFPVEHDMTAKIGRLGALLAERFPPAEPTLERVEPSAEPLEGLDPRDDLDANLAKALRRFAYVENDNLVYDVQRPLLVMTPDHFNTHTRQYYREEQGKLGGIKVARLSDLWMQHPDRFNVASVSMRPDRPWPLYREDNLDHVNTYRPVYLPTDGDAAPGFDFIARLLPDADERQYFLRWLACKVNNPAIRGPAIVMVAHDTYGTGRGTLVRLLAQMFSDDLVSTVDFKTLSGQTYQSQYNEWLVDNLIVAVNEAQEDVANLSKWKARNNAYEHLKDIIDPGETKLLVRRKGAKNTQGRSFASILVMTNHADALVIPKTDRRIAILTNGPSPGPDFFEEINAWLKHPGNIGAFVAELRRTEMGDYNPYAPPPMTLGKLEMVEAGESELDRALAYVLAQFNNTLVVKEQVIMCIEDYLADNNVDAPDDWDRMVDKMVARKTRKPPGVDRVRIEGRQRVIRMVGSVKPEVLVSAEAVVQEVLSNGPLTRPVKTSAKVVSFPTR